MNGNKMFKIIMIACFIVIIVLVILVYKYFNSNRSDIFTNKINLPQKHIVSFDSIIGEEYAISEQGKLFSVSLASQDIFVVDLSDGEIIKSIKTKKKFKNVKIVMDDNIAYFIFDNKYLYLVDTKTLKFKDIYYDEKARYYSNKAIIYEDIIIASDNYSKISAINLKNGDIVAERKVSLLRDIELYKDILYYREAGFNVFALEPNSLNLIWKYVKNYDAHVGPSIAYKDDKVYFNNVLLTKVFDAQSGELLNEFPLHATRINIFENNLYSFLAGKNITCVNLETGNMIWKMDIDTSSIRIVGESVFLQDNKEQTLKKLDRYNGNLIWSTSWNKEYANKVMNTNKYDIIQNKNGNIYVVDKDTGDKLWKFSDTVDRKKMFWTLYSKYLLISDGRNKIYIFNIEDQ